MKQDFGNSAEKEEMMVVYFSEAMALKDGLFLAEILQPDGKKAYVEYTEMATKGSPPVTHDDALKEVCQAPRSRIRILTRPEGLERESPIVTKARDALAAVYKQI